MEAILYDKAGTVKLGNLVNILDDSCYVGEERNGMFDLVFDYPNGYPLADQLIEENFIEVKPNDDQENQKFRIYNTKKFIDDTITVFARHETFDLANDHVENINLENASCEYALNTLFRNSHFSKDFRGYSDIVNAQDFAIDNVNILNAIAGKEGSIIDTYGTGAEILRDGKNIHVLNKRGHDNGVTVEYGKNLTGFELSVDLEGLETRCGGFAKYKPEGSKEEIVVKSDWVDSPFIDNFSHPYISVEGRRDYSDKFKDGVIPTKESLNELCRDEFKINKRDIPTSNYKINFIPLSKCVGYEGIEDKISLCDTVTIIDPRFNINTKAKVIKYKYDFVKERYISMELGEPRTTLGDIIGNGGKGEQGPPGPPGKDGADGNIGDFPNSLPPTPILTAIVKGFASIDLSWTYEDKIYYTYEVYASKTKDFTPNTFDLIHEGQTSSFLFQAKPNETWYFKACAKNTHGDRTAFSAQVSVTTKKADDFDEYFSSLAVGSLVTNIFSADYMEAGIIKGHWIDAKNLSVTDGNGKRTLDINSFGKVVIDSDDIKVRGKDVSTIPYVDEIKTELVTEIKGFEEKITPDALKRVFSTDFYTKDSANSQFTSKTEFEQNNKEFLMKIEQTGRPQLIPNGALREGTKFWSAWQAQNTVELFGGYKWFTVTPQFELGTQSFGILMPEIEVQAGKTYTVGAWVSGDVTSLNYNFLMQLKNGAMEGIQRIDSISIGNVSKQAKRVSVTFTALTTGFVQPMFGYEGVMSVDLKIRLSEACCFEGYFLYPYQEANNTIYTSNAYFDITGMGMKHKDGSISRITHESFELTDVYERLKMAMKKGTLYAYDVDNGSLLGMFGSNRLNTNYKGVTTGIAGSSHYYAIGVSHELTDSSDLTMKPYMVIAQQDLQNVFGFSRMSAGINFMNTPAIFHEPVHCKRFFAGTGVYSPNSILSLGYTDVTSNYQTAFAVDGGTQRLKGYMPLDMNGWQIYNASLGYSVVNNGTSMRFKSVNNLKSTGNIFDEIEVVNPSVRNFKADSVIDSIGELDVTNVTNKDEIMLDEYSADLGKLVTVLFKEVKELKTEIKRLKEGV